MKVLIFVACLSITKCLAAPKPQNDFDPDNLNQQFFDEDNINQQGRLTPQGFSQPRENLVRQTQSFFVPNGATVVRYFYDLDDLHYKYTYELSDGTIKSEEGTYKDGTDNDGNPVKILVVSGAYSYTGADGETYWTKYEADENGYRPQTGKGVGGIKPGEDAGIDPNLLKSLIG